MQSEVRGQGPIVRLASYRKQHLNFSLPGHNLKQESPCGPSGCGVAQASSDEVKFEAQRARKGTLDLFEFGLQVRNGSGGKCRQQGRPESTRNNGSGVCALRANAEDDAEE